MVKNFFLIMLLSFFAKFVISFRSRRTLQALRSLEFCIKKIRELVFIPEVRQNL